MPAVKADLSNVDADLKDLYTHNTIAELVYPENPILGWMPKGEMGGRRVPVPLRYGLPTGRSKTFSNAQANASPSKFESWDMTATRDYADVLIDGLAAYSTDNKNEAFMALIESELEGGMRAVAMSLEISLARKTTGSRGQVTGTVGSATISTLLKSDVTNFEVGQLLRFSATDGAAHRTGSEAIAGIDRVNNTLTSTSAAWNTVVTALAANDFIYVDGDLNASLSGFEDWIPAAAPSSTLFYGVNRQLDSRLGGSRYDGSSDLIKDALVKGMALGGREGARGDRVIWVNDAAYAILEMELAGNVQYTQVASQQMNGPYAKVGFEAIKIATANGSAAVMASRAVPQNVAWGGPTKAWELLSIHDPVVSMEAMDDVGRVLRAPSDDAYEGRCHFYGNAVCHFPGSWVRIQLPASTSL
jgi:hypothetical protein